MYPSCHYQSWTKKSEYVVLENSQNCYELDTQLGVFSQVSRVELARCGKDGRLKKVKI